MADGFSEFVMLLISSAGLSGSVLGIVFSAVLKKAHSDAAKKREERLLLEIQRLEGEELMSNLLFALVRFSRGLCDESELEEAEKDYLRYIQNSRAVKNRILGSYTAK